MPHKDRALAALNRERPDRLPYVDSLWAETVKRYTDGGLLKEGEDCTVHFDMSVRRSGWIQSVALLDHKDEIVEETNETILKRDGNGALLRRWKNRSGTPEHVDFLVQDRSAWEEHTRPNLLPTDRRRIPFADYRKARSAAAQEGRFFCWEGVGPFEQMHPLCGHEHMLVGMALDPDWVKDMVMTYADLTIRHQELLFSEEGRPDAFWFFEDMGFKERPFMSPSMYREIVQPGHKKLFDYAHSLGCKVIVHSCGYVAPLVPGLIEAGMDCLQAMEVKAGMDMLPLAREFGKKISFCGNIDIREIASNDPERIKKGLDAKIRPVLDMGCGYILHSDHSIPPEVDYASLKLFFEYGSAIPA